MVAVVAAADATAVGVGIAGTDITVRGDITKVDPREAPDSAKGVGCSSA
jgi:hypothetical protein